MMDAAREARRHFCDGILTIDGDKVGERGEQGGIGKSFGLDAVVQCFFPGVDNVTKRHLPICIGSRGSQSSPS
jgi:hypothetical protein